MKPANSVTQTQRGFTLVEMLVYMAILVVVVGASVTLLLSLSQYVQYQRAYQAVLVDGTTVLERFLLDARSAATVNVLASTLADPNGVLVLETAGTPATTTLFSVVDGAVVVSINGVTLGPITTDAVSVPRLTFFHYDSGRTETVRVRLTLTATVGATTVSRDFFATTVLNNSYE